MGIYAPSGTWTIGSNWPWPQVYFLKNYVLAVAVDGSNLSLYELTIPGGIWTAVKVATLGPSANIITVDFADFGSYYVVSATGYVYSGELTMPWGVFDQAFEQDSDPYKVLYERNPAQEAEDGAVTLVSSNTIPYGESVCNYKGQLIVGGLESNNTIWSGLGSCSVAWSGIGNNLCDPEDDITAGFMKMPWNSLNQGLVYKVMRLGDVVRVYGNGGVMDMLPVNQENAVTFGELYKDTVPILSQDAVAGNRLVQVCLDKEYNLYLSTAKEGLKKLGYKNYLSELVSGRLVVRYDEKRKRFYISDGSLSYVFTEGGLYSTHQCMTSVGRFDDVLAGFVKSNNDTKIRLAGTSMDFGHQGLKTVEAIEYGVNYDSTNNYVVEASVSGKYSYKGDFVDLGWITLNERGIQTQKISAREVKFKLRSTYESGADFNLSSVKVKIKFSDKRNIRGRLNVT